MSGGHTDQGELSEKLIGVRRLEPFDEIGMREFTSDDGSEVEGLVLIQCTSRADWTFRVVAALGSVANTTGVTILLFQRDSGDTFFNLFSRDE